jgi:formamidopyrimidine-DNA glycosylase
MPEGPEVFSFALDVYDYLYNKQLLDIKIHSGKYKRNPFIGYDIKKDILPSKILSVSTLGKLLLLELENNYFLVISFGMTGYITHYT